MTFGDALKLLKVSEKVTRAGWNGKGQYLELQRAEAYSKVTAPFISIRTVDGGVVPWVASQSDLLEEDWQQV